MLGEPGFPGVERDASVGILGIGVRTAAQNQGIRIELTFSRHLLNPHTRNCMHMQYLWRQLGTLYYRIWQYCQKWQYRPDGALGGGLGMRHRGNGSL